MSQEDYAQNLEFIIPENFNFAYDVMDLWAAEQPDKQALLWTNEDGQCISFSFGELKQQTDRAASYFQSLGIGKGDMVMLILKRHYEFWLSMLALCKIGAVAIPATHMLTRHDIVYRNNRAGEALNAAVYRRFYELTGIRLMEGFGQTETTMTLGTMPWTQPKPGSMGLPNPQYDIDLVKPDGTPCEDGEKGEIVVRVGKDKPVGLFKEYYRDEELTRSVWYDGVYHTGDVAWRDEDGYYWFEGRIDDVIKSSGYRIGPFEVESALMTHPAVVECAITGVPDDIRGMVVKATVVLHADWKSKAGSELVKELQQHVKHETAPYKYPRIIEFVDELPKTISGKIRRVEIRNKDSK